MWIDVKVYESNVYDLKLLVHYLTSMWLGAAHISKFILTNNTCIYMYCNKNMGIEKKICESNVYDLKLLVHTLSHEFI